jgi:DNA polymerase I-like protein with 3'-5' exonuclease and polymerase domains
MIKTQMGLFEVLAEVDSDIIRELTPEFEAAWLAATAWALDIETYGNKNQGEALNPFAGEIRLIQGALDSGEVAVFDVWQKHRNFLPLLNARMADDSFVVIHNASFELMWLEQKFGVIGKNIFDTMICSQVLYAGIQQYRHNLKAVCLRELKVELNKDERLSDFGIKELSASQINYAANDVRHLVPLAIALMAKIRKEKLTDTLNIELGALPSYAEMGLKGFPICVETLDHVLSEYQRAYQEVFAPIAEALGVDSTANSDLLLRQLSDYLKVGLSGTNKTELSQYSDNPIVQGLLDARTLKNYCDYIERCKASVIDGSVRGNFRQCAPKGLGRATCGDDSGDDSKSTKKESVGIPGVNLQNPPNPSKASPTIKSLGLPAVRSFFKPNEGQSLLVFDFSAAHARIAAETTQDELFIKSYVDNIDCHAIVASQLCKLVGKHWSREEISKIRKQKDDDGALATRLRNISKNIFYGWLNGAGANKTMQTIHAGGLSNATIDDAKDILDLLSRSFPGISGFHQNVKQQLKKVKLADGTNTKYATIRAISGRRVFTQWYAPKHEKDRGGCNPNESYIAHWMMTESDAKKRAMTLIWKKARLTPEWGMRLANECHDEIDVLCDSEHVEEVAKFCWSAMNGSLGYWVKSLPAFEDPYSLEGCLAKSWADK